MKRINLMLATIASVMCVTLPGCDLQELSASKDEPRCEVNYTVVFSNTSKSDIYMGLNNQPASSDIVKPGSSRTINQAINLLMSHGYEEEHIVEMYIRGISDAYYNYKTYSIRPKQWNLTLEPGEANLAYLKLRITCNYTGTDVVITVTQI